MCCNSRIQLREAKHSTMTLDLNTKFCCFVDHQVSYFSVAILQWLCAQSRAVLYLIECFLCFLIQALAKRHWLTLQHDKLVIILLKSMQGKHTFGGMRLGMLKKENSIKYPSNACELTSLLYCPLFIYLFQVMIGLLKR